METKTYTKKDIATQLAQRNGISVRVSKDLVDDFFNIVRDFLTEDHPYIRIEIRNFGVFESKPPQTNEEIYVPAHKKTRFKPGKILKAHLRKPL